MNHSLSEAARQRPNRILHTMLRVSDLPRAIKFYCEHLGMRLFRQEDYPEGAFTLAFLGYGDESAATVLELTFNWSPQTYERGNAFGHIALEVDDLQHTCTQLVSQGVVLLRPPGLMSYVSPQRARPENIAFIEDPDGYRIELVEKATH